jgi:hypothetical protein
MSQQSRRHDPYPWTWELPLGVLTATLLLLTTGVHLARAIANLLVGGGWRFPARADLFTSVSDVLAGDASAGLPSTISPVASQDALTVSIGLTELAIVAIILLVLKCVLNWWGPSRMKGMASRAEAEQLLGVTRLRRNSAIIRPDLYRTGRTR